MIRLIRWFNEAAVENLFNLEQKSSLRQALRAYCRYWDGDMDEFNNLFLPSLQLSMPNDGGETAEQYFAELVRILNTNNKPGKGPVAAQRVLDFLKDFDGLIQPEKIETIRSSLTK